MLNTIKIENLSPLRYPGSKKKLIPYLYKIIKYNDLEPNVLIEPFVGGGNITLHFLKNEIVEKAIISDSDELIYSFWFIVFTKPGYLMNFIKKVKIDLKTFFAYKEIAKCAEYHAREVLAEACIYLNRTSFSGLLTDRVGPLGGLKQNSRYKIFCRFNKERILDKIELISTLKKKVTVLPYDWRNTLKYVENWVAKRRKLNRILFYFDPPFYNKAEDLYRKYLIKEEHVALYESISSLKYDWILSYDNAPEIKKMYSQTTKTAIHVEMPYSVNSHSRRLEKELIITPLSLPSDFLESDVKKPSLSKNVCSTPLTYKHVR